MDCRLHPDGTVSCELLRLPRSNQSHTVNGLLTHVIFAVGVPVGWLPATPTREGAFSTIDNELDQAVRELWALHGKALSQLYAGTQPHFWIS